MTIDYATWDHESLIKRVTDLESHLQTLNDEHSATAIGSTAPTIAAIVKQKPRKKPKTFDPSRYSTRHIALKFAYLGANYNGFEHHTNNKTPLPTIEEVLWRALTKTKLIFPDFKDASVSGTTADGKQEVTWDGVDYSKCGRTDKGVSAFGQVVGLKVRSNRPKGTKDVGSEGINEPVDVRVQGTQHGGKKSQQSQKPDWDDVRDEIPYIQTLNRVLPPDIRVLAWCPHPPEGFSARFNCKERRYRYFFTNPAFPPVPGQPAGEGDGWLNIGAMQEAATKYEGLHDFRNFCKIDASKQITNFERRIFHAGVHEVEISNAPGSFVGKLAHPGLSAATSLGFATSESVTTPKIYWFEVRGSAFLWHQVRHLVAVLFLVGQGFEKPSLVDEMLDIVKTPSKPFYEMADDAPLVLWDCVFPSPDLVGDDDHAPADLKSAGYVDALKWINVGDDCGGRDSTKRAVNGIEDGRFGRNGVIEDLWAVWRERKIDELLAGSLMDIVADLSPTLDVTSTSDGRASVVSGYGLESARVFEGSVAPRPVGTYVPVLQRGRMETVDVINSRYAAQRGIPVGRRGRRNGSFSEQGVDGDANLDV
ncbi:pseudouridine synthase [Polychaeton citri CBS 116435]|uniref:Pseudouridine synthase n=1 Tax=Polychaeton citri CBS 116435 TaxID=1314669 RepID=A0A9P4Q7L5_9PEZI|nr:pseudouridine synthase [Polychaeton citri CBS 116435]